MDGRCCVRFSQYLPSAHTPYIARGGWFVCVDGVEKDHGRTMPLLSYSTPCFVKYLPTSFFGFDPIQSIDRSISTTFPVGCWFHHQEHHNIWGGFFISRRKLATFSADDADPQLCRLVITNRYTLSAGLAVWWFGGVLFGLDQSAPIWFQFAFQFGVQKPWLKLDINTRTEILNLVNFRGCAPLIFHPLSFLSFLNRSPDLRV